jgi:hypothetical protein
LRSAVASYATHIDVLELNYYWLLTFTTQDGLTTARARG